MNACILKIKCMFKYMITFFLQNYKKTKTLMMTFNEYINQ